MTHNTKKIESELPFSASTALWPETIGSKVVVVVVVAATVVDVEVLLYFSVVLLEVSLMDGTEIFSVLSLFGAGEESNATVMFAKIAISTKRTITLFITIVTVTN